MPRTTRVAVGLSWAGNYCRENSPGETVGHDSGAGSYLGAPDRDVREVPERRAEASHSGGIEPPCGAVGKAHRRQPSTGQACVGGRAVVGRRPVDR